MATPLVLVTLGLLMVSRVPYPHAIHAIVKQRHSFPFLAALVVLIGIAAIEWQVALVIVTLGYVAWGLLLGCYRMVTTGRIEDRSDDGGSGGDGDVDVGVQPIDPKRN
jgi:phosphatidylserine synthase